MKIFPLEKVREADAYTIEHEPIPSIDLMERAASTCFKWFVKKLSGDQKVMVFCGPGNNGGDGLAVARMLGKKGFQVEVIIVKFTDKFSEDFGINYNRLKEMPEITLLELGKEDKLPGITSDDVVIDALFGSGLSRPVKGFPADVIRHINKSTALVVAIDIPSGLFSDEHVDESEGAIIKADFTLSLQFPKLAFMFPQNAQFVGEWLVRSIGLDQGFIRAADVKNYYVEKNDCSEIHKPRSKFSHKGDYGHALLIAGGYGKMGASVLAARACISSGAGLVHAHTPKKGYGIIQTAVPEAMVSIDSHDEYFSEVPDLALYNAIAAGPGIGMHKQTQNALKLLIQNASVPLLLDADAINILGENKTWIPFIPKLSIFTPHPKEFQRLVGGWKNDFDRLRKQREFSMKNTAYIVLKGAHTSICCPDGSCYFNSTGNPGMASGGSGDILTGIILGLLAQRYHPKHACILGVYIHGLAGDLAARDLGYEAVTATTITERIGKAFRKL